MAKNLLALITFLVEELQKPGTRGFLGRAAFQSVAATGTADATSMATARQNAEMYQQINMAEVLEPGAALSCGVTANALCRIFAGTAQFANTCTGLDALRTLVADGRQRAIRITMAGHTFVIEQVQTVGSDAPPQGNIYQSNVAVINNTGHLGITIKKYLRENPNPVNLDTYIESLINLTGTGLPAWTQLSIYKDLFTVKSYRNNPEVHPITSDELTASRGSLAITGITWQYFRENDVLDNIVAILNAPEYRNVFAATRAREIFHSA